MHRCIYFWPRVFHRMARAVSCSPERNPTARKLLPLRHQFGGGACPGGVECSEEIDDGYRRRLKCRRGLGRKPARCAAGCEASGPAAGAQPH